MICTAITAATIITVTTVIHKITARTPNVNMTIVWVKITRATMIAHKIALAMTTVTRKDNGTIVVEMRGGTNNHNLVTNHRKMRLRSVAEATNHNRAVVLSVLGRVGEKEKETVARSAEAKDKVLAVRQNGAKRLAMTVEDGKGAAQPSRRLRESTKVNEEEGEE